MTGRIVYKPVPQHPCAPPTRGLHLLLTGTQWQCDDCWELWTLRLDSEGLGSSWQRSGNPGERVELDGDYHVHPRLTLTDPGQPERDPDAKRITLILMLVLFAIVGVLAYIVGTSDGWWPL